MQLKNLFAIFAVVPLALATYTTPQQNSCKSSEFWWKEKSCCLPHGGPPTPPKPPKDTNCPPTSYYWNPGKGCCVPRNPPPTNPPPPQCPKNWTWYPSLWRCLPTPTPPTPPPSHPSPKPPNYPGQPGQPGHGGWGGHKRELKARTTLCPNRLDACPISGLAGDYECVDTTSELEFCGGCVTDGKGEDCTKIEGAWNVGCDQGSCVVLNCAGGFKIGADGRSCIEA